LANFPFAAFVYRLAKVNLILCFMQLIDTDRPGKIIKYFHLMELPDLTATRLGRFIHCVDQFLRVALLTITQV